MAPVQVCECWIYPILNYLKDGILPVGRRDIKRIKYISNQYAILDGALYKRGYVIPFLTCLHPHQEQAVLLEIHERSMWGECNSQIIGSENRKAGIFLAYNS